MLRQNIDTKAGLVNGAIGTVVAITATQITITHTEMTRLSQPCDKVVTTMSTIDKVVTTLWIGCQQLTRL